MSTLTKSVRQTVLERDGYRCIRCGKQPVLYSAHHRVPRGMGGSRLAWINQPANILTTCGSGVSGCHGYIESHRTEAYNEGWLLHRRQVPWEVPVRTHRGYLLLDNDGGYEVCPEEWHKPFRDGHYDERPF